LQGDVPVGQEEDSIQESDLVLQGFEPLQKRLVNLKIHQKRDDKKVSTVSRIREGEEKKNN
jgi:hypothetical protein